MEHSIEELERQYRSACSKARDATAAEQAARERLSNAKSKASGLEGKWLKETRAGGRTLLCTYVMTRYGDFVPKGFRLLANGTLGAAIVLSWREYTIIPRPDYVKPDVAPEAM